MFDNGDILTIVQVSGKWYLAGIKCFYYKLALGYGIQQGDGKISYGVYNSSTKTFEFTTNDATTATPIDLNYVLSAVPGSPTNSDDQFLSGTTVNDLLTATSLDKNYTLTFSGLAGKVKSSV